MIRDCSFLATSKLACWNKRKEMLEATRRWMHMVLRPVQLTPTLGIVAISILSRSRLE